MRRLSMRARYGTGVFLHKILNGVLIISNNAKKIEGFRFFNFDEITTIKIPESIESIGESAFACCYQLTNIIIGENVKTIGNQAFSHCYELKSITFPPCLTSIGNEAFRSCINLSSVTFVADIKEIGDFAFYRCPKVIINAPAGSEIEKYAKRNNLKFNAL